KISSHVFKVGAYKTAVEPYTGYDMSPEARDAKKFLYDELWVTYIADLKQLRDIDARILSGDMNDFLAAVAEHNDNLAEMAVGTGLVTDLYSRDQFRQEMVDLTCLDDDGKSWRIKNLADYNAAIKYYN